MKEKNINMLKKYSISSWIESRTVSVYVAVYFSEHTAVSKYIGQTILNYSFLRIKSYEYRMNIKAKANQGR